MPPFWKDKPDPYAARRSSQERVPVLWRTLMGVYTGLVSISLPALIFWLIARPLLYVWLAFCAVIVVRILWLTRRSREEAKAISALQADAYRSTGADFMGSANHVAGHPAQDRDQRILLAVAGNALRIYGFAAPDPLGEIPGSSIRRVDLVVYDDERIPHLDAIDPAAQALQITFDRGAVTSRCLFNRMAGHKPIDWFHELEKLRSASNP
jgi:hypothetical protein